MSVITKAMTEEQLLVAITEALTLHKWRWVHFRRSDKAQMMGNPGFPDICAARKGRVLFLELKRQGGRVSPDQDAWLDAINLIPDGRGYLIQGGVRAIVVWPDSLDHALAMLE